MGLGVRASHEMAGPLAVDDAGDELSTVDENVVPLLRLFDDLAIKVRTGTARDYTELAQKLSPTAGGGLVRRPRQSDLINDALIPALQDVKDDNARALSLLRQALVWYVEMPEKSKGRVSIDGLLVPVRGRGDSWDWVEPDSAYLGEGWDSHPNIELISKAFGMRPRCQLIPWVQFEKKAIQLFKDADKGWWVQRMIEIGVWDCPRILQTDRHVAPN